MLTLSSLEGRELERLQLSDEAADRAYEITASAAPHNPVVLATRLQHLFLSDRWKEKRVEIEDLLERLKKTASLHVATWFMHAVYASLVGDERRLIEAIHIGRSLDKPLFEQFAQDVGVVIR